MGIGDWLSSKGKAQQLIDDFDRGDATQFILNQQGISVQFLRGSSVLDAQTIAIAHDRQSTVRGETGESAAVDMFLIGLPALDVKPGDIFLYEGVRYQVESVDDAIPGRTKAQIIAMR